MKKNLFVLVAAIVVAAIFFATSCNNETPAKEQTESAAPVAVTNPNFSIAPIEYSELAEKALGHLGKFEYDAWADMLADNVVYMFPDGDVDTRTKLEGKTAVLGWWKNWKDKSGIESMTMSEINYSPLNATGQLKGGAPSGVHVISYFSNKMIYSGKTVAVRMNFVAHFNTDKKIDRYTTYYDRSVIIKATGSNILGEAKAN